MQNSFDDDEDINLKLKSVNEWRKTNKNLIVLEKPGMGKSTVLNYLTYCDALKNNSKLNNWAKSPFMLSLLVSVMKEVGSVDNLPRNNGKLVERFINDYYNS
jgi:energy-coupling factor transporter ATP-binding protein EcfA2